jgi:hypothetical protein
VNIKNEEISDVEYEEETLVDAKKEDIRWHVTSPTIKAEHYQVITCVFLHVLNGIP